MKAKKGLPLGVKVLPLFFTTVGTIIEGYHELIEKKGLPLAEVGSLL